MTDKEAKNKWCPFVRVEDGSSSKGQGTVSINRIRWPENKRPEQLEIFNCKGSDCAVWVINDKDKGSCGLSRQNND